MKRILSTVIASSILILGVTACEVPEEDGTAADRSEVNSDSGTKGGKAKKGDKAKKATATPEESTPEESAGQENARESAESYLDMSAFSRDGLIKQLKFEGYSEKDAAYGVDAQNADWNKQAAASAQAYLDMSSFSRDGLVKQLTFEGYTREQAEYGVAKVGL